MQERSNGTALRRLTSLGLAGALVLAGVPAAPLYADTAADLAAARSKLEEIGRKSDQTTRELEELSADLTQTQGEIEAKQGELSACQDELSGYVSSEYKAGSTDLLQMLLGSDSFNELISRVFYMNKVATAQADTIASVKAIKAELSQKQADQEKGVADAERKVEELNSQRADASATVSALDSKLQAELAAEAAANAALTAGLQASKQEQVTTPVSQDDGINQPTLEPGPTPAPEQNQPAQQPDPEPSYDASTGNAVVDRAYSWLGKAEYVYGACAPGQFDCSGFVSYCLTGQYTRLGSTHTFMRWTRVSDPQPGDVCTSDSHCGIYIGNGEMIHASTWGVGVIKSPVRSNMIYVRR